MTPLVAFLDTRDQVFPHDLGLVGVLNPLGLDKLLVGHSENVER